MNAERFARVLGWLSIGLGLVEVVVPKRFGRYVGLKHRPGLLRLYGLREIGSGAAILARRDPTLGVWSRVAGGTLDLAALGAELVDGNPKKGRVAVAAGAAAAIGAVDVVTAQKLTGAAKQDDGASPPGVKEAKRVVTVGKTPDELYRLWRDPQTPSRVTGDAVEVAVRDEKHAHWTLHGPLGRTFEWDTELVEERPGELLRWRSLPDAAVPSEGTLTFRPAPRNLGTEVVLEVRYSSPDGLLGAVSSVLPGFVPEAAIGTALRRFKSLAETGRVVTSDTRPDA
jgi:uncharacterized membrane protein